LSATPHETIHAGKEISDPETTVIFFSALRRFIIQYKKFQVILQKLHHAFGQLTIRHGINIVTISHKYHPNQYNMEKMEKLGLMDKVLRELDDLKNSQTSVLKKLSQIEADNINLGIDLLDKKLPDIHEEVDGSINIIGEVIDEFKTRRDKFYNDNNLGSLEDPTAKK